MRNLDSFEVFRSIKDGIRLFSGTLDCYVGTHIFKRIFDVEGDEYLIYIEYNTKNYQVNDISIFDVEKNYILVDNKDFLRGLILVCLFDTYK